MKALEIDDNLAEAHATLASTRAGEQWDLAGALTELARAIQLNPNYATGHQWYAEYLICSGDAEKAITQIRRAQELDPLSLVINSTYGYILLQARRYDEAFRGTVVRAFPGVSGEGHAYHLYVVEVDERRRVYDELRARQILTQVHYIPVHTMPYYQATGFEGGPFPRAEAYAARALSLPMYPGLTDEEQAYVIEAVLAVTSAKR